jgi:hypothetical protein
MAGREVDRSMLLLKGIGNSRVKRPKESEIDQTRTVAHIGLKRVPSG